MQELSFSLRGLCCPRVKPSLVLQSEWSFGLVLGCDSSYISLPVDVDVARGCWHLPTTSWPALSACGINKNEYSNAGLYPRVMLGCFFHYTLLQQWKNSQAYICLLFWHSPEASAAADRCPGRHKIWDRFFWLGKSGQWWTHWEHSCILYDIYGSSKISFFLFSNWYICR